MNSDSESKVSPIIKLQLEFHPIIRNFPACVSHFAVFGTLFIEYRIGVVDMDQDPPTSLRGVALLKQATRPGKRQVPNFPGRLRPDARGNQFVLSPERSVDQTKIARSHPVFPFL